MSQSATPGANAAGAVGSASGVSTAGAAPEQSEDTRLTAWVHGRVQGVGFRWDVRSRALELGLLGFAKNYPDGRVLVIAEGSPTACQQLLDYLNGPDTRGEVRLVLADFGPVKGEYADFTRR